MKRISFIIFWCVFFIYIFVHPPAFTGIGKKEPPATKSIFSPEQIELLDAHNKIRLSKGIESLSMNQKLCEYAQKHAEYMAEKKSMKHSSMSKLQEFCGAGLVGENIAWGQETVGEVMSGWMWSPMHRWNILGSSYKKAGFGVKKDADGRNYWCVVFSD